MEPRSAPQPIPTELWLRIFHFATNIIEPGSECPRIDYPGRLRCVLPSLPPGTVQKALKTKRALVLVCKQWNFMATPFRILYHHLSISTQSALEKLISTLSDDTGPNKGSFYGRLVKRLDLKRYTPRGVRLYTAVELCQRLPNLVTFLTELEARIDPSPLFNVLPPTLRHLHIQERFGHWEGRSLISIAQVASFMDSHPNLTSISFPYVITESPPLSLAEKEQFCWPSIRKWTFLDRRQPLALASYVPRGAFPNLEDVHFSECTNDHYKAGNWNEAEEFLAAHGTSLVSVGLAQEGLVHISARLRVVDQLCPRIKEIDISFNQHRGRTRVDAMAMGCIIQTAAAIQMHQVLSLGIRMCSLRYEDERIEDLHSIASLPWTDVFPRLQRIRVLEELDVESSSVHDAPNCKGRLEASGTDSNGIITFEDIDGRLLGRRRLPMGGS
ncbi:hypothetical protein DFP72DRAFT_902793 [Ephemerocybe angulata]|uniref:F-box domain-containing protein n=1 Tax=Ephemerocybe angulata TaxID=980116 RepID=A0A8H6HUA8_9AGAR|nr:hypothetical protein DFP72DRAFT_902793 [Tulosesus angulatus]